MRLFELQMSGDGSPSGPYAYYTYGLEAARQYYEEAIEDNPDADDQVENFASDRDEMAHVATSFLHGMPAGIRAFKLIDTMLQDYMLDYWEESGLDAAGEIHGRKQQPGADVADDQGRNIAYKILEVVSRVHKIDIPRIQQGIKTGNEDEAYLEGVTDYARILQQAASAFAKGTKTGVQFLRKIEGSAESGEDDAYQMIVHRILPGMNLDDIYTAGPEPGRNK